MKGLNRVAGSAGQGSSAGRDVDELLMRFVESLGDSLQGATGQLVADKHGLQGRASAGGEMHTVDGVQLLKRYAEVEVLSATISRTYQAPYRFRAAAIGSGRVSLSWKNAETRFDTYQNVLRRGASGGSAPAAPGDGTGVTINGGVLGTGATDTGLTPGGVYSYSLFHVYSEVNVGDRSSAPSSKTVTVT